MWFVKKYLTTNDEKLTCSFIYCKLGVFQPWVMLLMDLNNISLKIRHFNLFLLILRCFYLLDIFNHLIRELRFTVFCINHPPFEKIEVEAKTEKIWRKTKKWKRIPGIYKEKWRQNLIYIYSVLMSPPAPWKAVLVVDLHSSLVGIIWEGRILCHLKREIKIWKNKAVNVSVFKICTYMSYLLLPLSFQSPIHGE